MRKLAPLFSLFLLLLLSSPIAAQSSPTIEQGVVTFTGSSSNPIGRFTFMGPQFLTLTGGLTSGNFSPSCGPCVGGDQIRIYSNYNASSSIRPGNLTTGTGTRIVHYSGDLTTNSAPVTLPIRYGRLPFKIIVPITLVGFIEVHATDPFVGPNLIFQAPLSLQGIATLTLRTIFIDFIGRPVYQFMGLTYDFPRPQVTTENEH